MKNNQLIVFVAIGAFLIGSVCGYALHGNRINDSVQTYSQNIEDRHVEEAAKFFGASAEDAKKIARGENVEFHRKNPAQKQDTSN